MLKVIIWGIGGRMGRTLLETINNKEDITCVGGYDKFADPAAFSVPVFNDVNSIDVKADVIIDFSRAEAIYELLPFAKANKLGVVLCSTGHSEKDMEFIKSYSKDIAIFKASNMSLGINLLIELVKKASDCLMYDYDIEIIEQHHNVKVDAPSGTALTIAKAINGEYNNEKEFVFGRHSMNERRKKQEIGIHAVRGGTVVGKHNVMFLGNDEIISVSHEAQSKAVFTVGAVRAALFLKNKDAGMYDMPDMINSSAKSISYKGLTIEEAEEKISTLKRSEKILSISEKRNIQGSYDVEIEIE